jgi:hypothetical protein
MEDMEDISAEDFAAEVGDDYGIELDPDQAPELLAGEDVPVVEVPDIPTPLDDNGMLLLSTMIDPNDFSMSLAEAWLAALRCVQLLSIRQIVLSLSQLLGA